MAEIDTFEAEFTSANILGVVVGTNCPRGGDSGHGGRTLLRLTDLGSTDLRAGLNGDRPQPVESIEIVLGGDTECDTLIQALEFAASTLRRMQSSLEVKGGKKTID